MNFTDLFSVDRLLYMLYSLPAIVLSLSMHEFAHAYAAWKCGDSTAKLQGRLTLDPLAHLDPIGFFSLLLLGFGWAKPVPVTTAALKNGKKSERIVSLAGIIMNLLLAVFFCAVYFFVVYVFGVTSDIVINILWPFVYINVVLAVFNLIPIPPLDGFHFLFTFVNRYKHPKPVFVLERYGSYILLGLMLLGVTDFIVGNIGSYIVSGLFAAFSAVFQAFM